MRVLQVNCSKMGLTIGSRKTKIFAVRPADRPSQPPKRCLLKVADDPVSVGEVCEYLHVGSIISADCSLDREINSCISKALCNFRNLCSVLWYQRGI